MFNVDMPSPTHTELHIVTYCGLVSHLGLSLKNICFEMKDWEFGSSLDFIFLLTDVMSKHNQTRLQWNFILL